jgi:putative flippase GtrA
VTGARGREWFGRLTDRRLLLRYLVAGLASALSHATVLVVLVEGAGLDPVPASVIGFGAGLVVGFALQHRWVYASAEPPWRTGPRFLVVTGGAFAVNLVTMAVGTRYAPELYLVVQLVAFVLIPLSNYTLNTLWTFAARRDGT